MSETTAQRLELQIAGNEPQEVPEPEGLGVQLSPALRPVLEEARRLTGEGDVAQLIRMALTEMIERRRFQNWVEARDSDDQLSGRA